MAPTVLNQQMIESFNSTSSVYAQKEGRFQDVVGRFPQLKTYNQLLLIFPCISDIGHGAIVKSFADALIHIIKLVPWLGEQVVHEARDGGSSGLFSTTPFSSPFHAGKMLVVKEASDLCPCYEDLERHVAPISMLDGKILCPVPAWPLRYTEADVGEAPVVVFQLTFIKNGLLLNFSNQHNMVDGVGAYAIFKLLSMVMQGRAIPQSLIDQANMDRRKVIPLLGPDEPLRDHSHLLQPINLRSGPASAVEPQLTPPPSRWVVFHVLRKSIPDIKRSASRKDEFLDPSVKYVSTNDALCAFYWKRLASTRIRNGSITEPDIKVSKFLRAVDARSAVGVPIGYMGQMVYHAATRYSYRELAGPHLTLSALASRLRADLNASNTEWAVRSYATFLAGVANKAALVYGGGFDPSTDIGNSSMSQLDFGALDFGPLGKPSFMRRPNLTPVPGVMYVLGPEGEAGDLPVLLCLPENDIKGLQEDVEWGPSTKFIG